MISIDADVAVLGSGFGGSLSALTLARSGLSPVVIDRARHPRFAIGESSTPIADMILRDLAEQYRLPRVTPLAAFGSWRRHYPHLGVGRKRGFSYFYHRPGVSYQPDPDHAGELLVAASADDDNCDTQWLRADVDAFLADEVRRAGIPLLENAEVDARHVDGGWELKGMQEGEPVTVQSRFLIDATGAGGALAQTMDLNGPSSGLHTHSRAIYSHFTGVRPWHDLVAAQGGAVADHPFPCDAAALHHVFDGGWMWVLRFEHDLVSAGFTLDTRRHPLDPAMSPEEEWEMHLARFPSVREQFSGARTASSPGRIVRTGRLQRRVVRAAGASWALLPHTAGFVDPLHSTGIAHTLAGVERLTALLVRHWGRATLKEAMDEYGAAVLRELALIDALVATAYEAASSFRLYAASVMLYFAATVTYEQERMRGAPGPAGRLFLCADDERLVRITSEALGKLRGLRSGRDVDPEAICAFEAYVEEAIAPYNTVGLFHPPRPNMYHHTAART